jgi:hypothetical protein
LYYGSYFWDPWVLLLGVLLDTQLNPEIGRNTTQQCHRQVIRLDILRRAFTARVHLPFVLMLLVSQCQSLNLQLLSVDVFSYPESTLNIGAIVGTLDRQLKDEMKATCKKKTGKPFCALKESNQAPFCKAMNNKSMYKGARPDFISTYNPEKWNASVGSVPKPVDCPNGGTYTNCNSAACYDGYAAPLSLQKMPHANLFNATCYCPYYVTTDSVTVWNAPVDNPCGPSNPKEVTTGSVIFNGL